MKYRHLGKSGVRVSEIALGSWLTYGYSVDDEMAAQTIQTALKHGINFFDTADVYNNHEAENVLGHVLGDITRSDLFIGSKTFFPVGEGPNDQGLSRKHIFESIEVTLEALDMDYLDLYQCHRYDEETPLEETVRAMSDLVRQDYILYWGVSMWSAPQIREACRIADEINGYRPVSNQPVYNLINREVEINNVQNTCEELGLGLVVFSPLAQGILTGKYAGGDIPENSRAANDQINTFIKNRLTEENLKRSGQLTDMAKQLNTTPAVLSLSWLLRQRAMSSVIVGASNPNQIVENIRAVDLELPTDIVERLNEIFPTE